MQARAQFPPEPRSASQARHWVRDHLNDLGRTDLVSSAETGVSELVTNGILHAQTSIGLALSCHRDRVVIEVYDGSPMSQRPTLETAAPSTTESTIGRGLRIVRAHAREWGVSTTSQGKAIWFQPMPTEGEEPVTQAAAAAAQVEDDGDVDEPFDLDAALDELAEAFPDDAPWSTEPAGVDSGGPVQVRLLGAPAALVQHFRKRWLELVREMHLVALAEPSAHQALAQRFCAAEQVVDPYLYVIESSTSAAVSANGAVLDVLVEVPRGLRAALVKMRDLAREMERDWAGDLLLFVHPGEQAAQLREWWLGELVAQIDGTEPTPWPGETRVRDEGLAARGSGQA